MVYLCIQIYRFRTAVARDESSPEAGVFHALQYVRNKETTEHRLQFEPLGESGQPDAAVVSHLRSSSAGRALHGREVPGAEYAYSDQRGVETTKGEPKHSTAQHTPPGSHMITYL